MAALRSYGYPVRDRQRNRQFFSGMIRGVLNASEGSKILTFLYRGPDWCAQARSPMRQGFSWGIGDWKLCIHIFSAKLAPNSQEYCEKQ
jgi:hypothetical protein